MSYHDKKTEADLASLARMLAGLDRQNDVQAELIDEARNEAGQSRATIAKIEVEASILKNSLKACESANAWLHGEVDRLTAERDAAMMTAEMNDKAGAAHAEAAERLVDDLNARLKASDAKAVRLHQEVDRLPNGGAALRGLQVDLFNIRQERDARQRAIMRAFIGADTKTMKRHEIADLLAPFIAEDEPLLQADRVDRFTLTPEGAAYVERYLSAKPRAQDPDPVEAPGHTDLMISPEEIEEIVEGVYRESQIPAGFFPIDLGDLPDDLAARIRADAPEGATFIEVDAAILPENVFRRIYALPPVEGAEPVKVAEQSAIPAEVEA